MPTYDYLCLSCGSVIEVIHSMLESGPSTCELCGGDLRRVLHPTGIIFKGSGFYRNDSRSETAARSSETSGTAPAKPSAGTGSDAKPSASTGSDSTSSSTTGSDAKPSAPSGGESSTG